MEGYLDASGQIECPRGPRGLRSGDLAVRGSRGELYIVERRKHVIVLPNGKKVFPAQDLHEDLASCPALDEFAVLPLREKGKGERIGMVIKPDVAVCRKKGADTLGGACRLVRSQILNALENKPAYMKDLDFCLTEVRNGEFTDLNKNAAGEPTPAGNEFLPRRRFRHLKDDDTPLPG
jgi:acyl-CoA synthetase (AMP-forming)/AMP-acid ligase II